MFIDSGAIFVNTMYVQQCGTNMLVGHLWTYENDSTTQYILQQICL